MEKRTFGIIYDSHQNMQEITQPTSVGPFVKSIPFMAYPADVVAMSYDECMRHAEYDLNMSEEEAEVYCSVCEQ